MSRIRIGSRVTHQRRRGIVTGQRSDLGPGWWSAIFRTPTGRWSTAAVHEAAVTDVLDPTWEVGDRVRTTVGLSGTVKAVETTDGAVRYGLEIDRTLTSAIRPDGLAFHLPHQILLNGE